MAIGEQPPETIDLVNWHELYNGTDNDEDAIIDGLAYRGRWTAIASPAKAGKSTIILALAVETAQQGHDVIYIDAEMGRSDVLDRCQNWMHLKPDNLDRLHYCDLPPKLDNVQGATNLWHTVEHYNPALVIIDGLNGVVNGAENDDTTWRDMYEWAISPIKQRNIAILTADNLGKARDAGPRGSSVKLDKADAVLRLERTETGVKLEATHRRSSSYPLEQEYVVTDASEEGPPMAVRRVGVTGYPAGTKELCKLLDTLGAPLDISRRKAQAILREHDGQGRKNDLLGKALRYRCEQADPFTNSTATASNQHLVPKPLGPPGTTGDHPSATEWSPWSPGPAGTTGTTPKKWSPNPGDHFQETPAYGVVPGPVSLKGPPPNGDQSTSGTTRSPKAEYEDPFA